MVCTKFAVFANKVSGKTLIEKKIAKLKVAELSDLWLGYPDSNQERQDQNLQCYHYTIPQFLNCGCKGSAFF